MDPRRQSYNPSADPRKRNASRSPEGGQARKQPRADQPRETPTGPSNNSGSRRSSMSNGTPRHPGPGGGTADGRGPSGQLGGELRTQTGTIGVNSPSNRSSPFEGGTSGRSTPQQRPIGLGNQPKRHHREDVPMSDAVDTGGPEGLLNLLTQFSSNIATQAALQASKDQAEARLKRTQQELTEVKSKFAAFPAIKERKLKERDAVQSEVKSKEVKLNEHVASQQQVMGTLAGLIGQISTPKPQMDTVSRAEFDRLQQNYEELSKDKDLAKSSMIKFNSELAEVKNASDHVKQHSNQVPAVQRDIATLKKDQKALQDWKSSADHGVREARKLDGRLKTVEDQVNATSKDFDEVKSDMQQLATKTQHDELDTKYEKLSQSVAGIQKKNVEFMKDIGNIKAKGLVSNLGQSPDPKALPTDTGLKEQVDKFVNKTEALATTVGELEEKLDQATLEITTMKLDVHEEGKDPIVKRVKNLDRIVNNLSSQTQTDGRAPLLSRLSQLERDHEALYKDFKSTRGNLQPDQSAIAGAMDLAPFTTRLDQVEKDLNVFKAEQLGKDDEVSQFVADLETSLQNEISDVKNRREEDLETINANLEKMTNFEALVREKASSKDLESVKSEVSTLSSEVKQLGAQHQRAKCASQTPTPIGPGHPPPQPHRLSGGASSHLSNGVRSSPQMNGVQHMPQPVGYNNGMPQPPPIQAQQIEMLENKYNSLVQVTQHLKQRCDNLTTDEVVRCMVDQFSAIYPEAKNFSHAIHALKKDFAGLSNRVTTLQREKDETIKQLATRVLTSVTTANEAQDAVKAVSEHAMKLEKDVIAACNAAQSVENELNNQKKDVQSHTSGVKPLSAAGRPNSRDSAGAADAKTANDIKTLRNDLQEVKKMAEQAHDVARVYSTNLDKANPDEMKRKLGELDHVVDRHDSKLKEGEEAIRGLRTTGAEIQASLHTTLVQIGTCKGKIDAMEKHLGS